MEIDEIRARELASQYYDGTVHTYGLDIPPR